ncbi:ABC transporter ATP-binding protein [Anaerosporobacter sp.]|uniref:ABC transporter ATP-binding protein n=1 Tax=Anaerosporobacter sp. TaxID=1872529 RepID=UPI00289C4D0B|nr:ABC transporter ATP-binding protein [Anaerosporobacter sp.]
MDRSMNNKIVVLDGLTKKYDNKTVVDHVSLDIEKGEIFGLLGPNGAGKSTMMNMVCSIKKPTMGNIQLFGYDTKKDMNKVKAKLGYIPQELAVHGNLKAWENVELFTSLYGLKGKELKQRVEESLRFVGLEDKRDGFAKNFSGGMKRRLNIACAIGHKPELLIFDEPTVGIDPQSRNFILEKIRETNKAGATVIYTSHYMEEIEAICTRVAIMDNGKIIAIGTKEDLVRMVSDQPCDSMSLEEVFLTLTGKKLRDYTEGGF